MFLQPELREDEVQIYEREVKARLPLGEASMIFKQLQKQVNAYKAGKAKLEDLAFQGVIIDLRAYLFKCRLGGPPGYEGYYAIATVVQQAIGWTALSQEERLAYSDFLGRERIFMQDSRLAQDKYEKWTQDVIEKRLTKPGDFMLGRAMQQIQEPFYQERFMQRLLVSKEALQRQKLASQEARLSSKPAQISGSNMTDATSDPDFGCYVCMKKTGLKHCSGCRKVLYCSKECQAEDWKKAHRVHCKHLQSMDQVRTAAKDALV